MAQFESADLFVKGGHIFTLDPSLPYGTAMAIKEGRVLAVGTEENLRPLKGPETEILDLNQKFVFPGFCESHGHILNIGRMKRQVELTGVNSLEGAVQRVQKAVSEIPAFKWIIGRGWDQNQWQSDFPDHRPLTRVAPQNPVALTRVDGHALWVNQLALDLAKINAETPDPFGGKIVKDSQGRPTGILIDRAMDLVEHLIPPRNEEDEILSLQAGIQECLKYGVTSFHDAWANKEAISLYEKFLKNDWLKLKLYVMLDGCNKELLREFYEKGPMIPKNGALTIRALKLFADGALGSCGAALFEEYANEPGNKGLALIEEDELFEITREALRKGFQVCTHAIGDRANHLVLNAYERALAHFPHLAKDGHRLRVEHAEMVAKEDVGRFSRSGIIASMQATHCTSDMPWIENRLGSRRAKETASVWRSLIETGALIANGSDAPIEHVNPLWGIYSSVTRMDHQGFPKGGWNPEQSMTRTEALLSFTHNGAYASFQEKDKGTLAPGKWGDFIVLSQDLFSIPASLILDTKVLLTVINGKIIYRLGEV